MLPSPTFNTRSDHRELNCDKWSRFFRMIPSGLAAADHWHAILYMAPPTCRVWDVCVCIPSHPF